MLKNLITIFLIIFFSCSDKKEKKTTIEEPKSKEQLIEDSINKVEAIKEADIYEEITYNSVPIDSKEILDSIKSFYKFVKGEPIHKIFLTLNRKELRFVKIGDTIVTPNKFVEDIKAYSIFPHLWIEAENVPKVLVVSAVYQSYGCYEYGKLVRFAACNTGKEKTPTYPGRYALTWKSLKRRSSIDSNWVLPYTFNFHRFAGNAFHQFDMPGYPVSHSCIRQFMSDAKWLYEWGDQVKFKDGEQIWLSGTPVLILGVPDYKRRKAGPWTYLKNNKEYPIKLDFDPMQVEEAYIPISQIPEDVRKWIPGKNRYKVAEDTLRARGIIAQNTVITPSVNFNKQRRLAKELKARKERQKRDSIKNATIQSEQNSDINQDKN